MQQDEMVTAVELGEWLGLSDRQVRDMAERKIIERPARGRYKLRASIQAAAAHYREIAAGRTSSDDTLDLVAERARLAKEQADAQAMTNATRRGQLVEVAVVCGALEDDLSRVRNRLLAVPSEEAAALVRHRTPLALQEALRDVIVDVLTELSAPRDYGKPKKAVVDAAREP